MKKLSSWDSMDEINQPGDNLEITQRKGCHCLTEACSRPEFMGNNFSISKVKVWSD